MQVAGKRKARPQIVSLAEEVEQAGAPETKRRASPPAKQTAAAWRVGTPPAAPVGAPETTASIAPAFKRGALLIQAGAFKVKENADRAHTTLGGIGSVEVAEIEMKGDTFFRVRVGPFRDRRKARAALSEVTKAGFQGAKIVTN
jgi:rare lipoprotein A